MPENSDGRQRPNVRGTPRSRLISSVVMLVIVAAGVVVYSIRKSNQLFDLGLEAHTRCALAGTYPALSPRFAPMPQALLGAAGTREAVSAHQCTIEDREYVHVILRIDAMLVSVLLTQKRDQETFPREFAGRTEEASGVTLHETRRAEKSVAAFESGNWLGYVISGLPEEKNSQLARKLVPVIDRYAKA
ncbi:MAG TPA: hypothetical protein VG297_19470 [Bryobacteraceae bacterium]|nr:hypothetical protein [Bryobacteraceae bacterium]